MHLVQLSMIALLTLAWGPQCLQADEATAKKSESVSVFGTATLAVPSSFKRAKVRSRIIEHEFQASLGEGDDAKTARVTMMAAGGDVQANIQRWNGQFSGGKAADQKSEEMKIGKWQVHIVDVTGSYGERSGGPFAGGKTIQRSDYAMAGAILVNPEGRKYFVKMIGPASVVKANRKAFVQMIKSIDN